MLLFELFEVERPTLLAQLEALGVSPIDIGILKEVSQRVCVPMGELLACRFHDRSSVTRIVDRLVKKGWIERREHAEDRRVKTLSLTPEGVEATADMFSKLSAPPPSVAELPEADQQRLVDILGRAIASAQARYAAEVALAHSKTGG